VPLYKTQGSVDNQVGHGRGQLAAAAAAASKADRGIFF